MESGRIRLKKIEDTVSMLKSLERYDGRSETFMMNAIAYLEDYLDYMNGEEVKTVKTKMCPGAATPNGHTSKESLK